VSDFTQKDRILELETPLGKDVLLLETLNGTEGISQLFRFNLEMLSTKNSIAYNQILGQKVTISIRTRDGKGHRYISGHVSRFVQGETEEGVTHYEAEVVPWLWFLSRYADCRIYQQKNVQDIIKDVFARRGFSNHNWKLNKSYPELEYCVQYRETDFNFVSRLLEHFGIFYFFEHTKEKHTLVLADAAGAHQDTPAQNEFDYDYSNVQNERDNVVMKFHMAQDVRPGKYALTDYNFETPSTDLKVNVDTIVALNPSKPLEIYDFPGDYLKTGDGNPLVKTRMEEQETPHLVAQGRSNCMPFVSGYKFKLDKHRRKDLNQTYVLTEVHHSASVGESYRTGAAAGADESYSNTFVCIPTSVPFRPPRLTPRPFVQGPQVAVVVGPSGEEIYTDKYGRVKVQFFWDRVGKKDDKSSCWIRVSQPWAGKDWGSIWNPRIGQEVIVEFLEGDPDRPIITGRVYNADQMPPYKLPDHQTVSTFKSRSSKKGGASNYNELRFEDNISKEQIFLHAERDMDQRVKKESREYVGKNRHLIVDADQKEKVGGNRHEEIGKDHVEKVGMNLHVKVGINHEEKVQANYALDAGAIIHLKAGANCVIEAPAGITLKAGSSFITLLPALIAIQGTMVLINSGGAALPGPGASPGSPEAPDKADTGDKFDKS
jgi:type VI secretion system secreted protein VgrG